ncbi:MAG TPA: RNA polymerase subunit sigma-70 [Pseudonocardiaceae bacterium]|nr:RNA polymerase subunit sigma-70 [Pseudonocardiaceae bacterium]
MAEQWTLADQAANPDPEMGLRSVRALRDLAERLEVLQVANARRSGWSWQEIANVLRVTRQAVHKKHRDIG